MAAVVGVLRLVSVYQRSLGANEERKEKWKRYGETDGYNS